MKPTALPFWVTSDRHPLVAWQRTRDEMDERIRKREERRDNPLAALGDKRITDEAAPTSRSGWLALRASRRAAGLCIRCGAQAEGKSMCATHREEHNAYLRKSRDRDA